MISICMLRAFCHCLIFHSPCGDAPVPRNNQFERRNKRRMLDLAKSYIIGAKLPRLVNT